jgi:hypothetical protein
MPIGMPISADNPTASITRRIDAQPSLTNEPSAKIWISACAVSNGVGRNIGFTRPSPLTSAHSVITSTMPATGKTRASIPTTGSAR